MEIKRHPFGPYEGRISVRHTIATMEVGEVWETNMEEVDLNYAQNCCSTYGRETGWNFTVSSPRSLNGQIIITRTA